MSDENNQQSESGNKAGENTPATSGAAGIVAKRRGRPKGSSNSASGGVGSKPGISPELEAEQQRLRQQFDKLYDPDAWEGIMSAPADIALAVTGEDIWNLSDKERKTLGIQASVTAQCFAVSDPKWLALTMLGISLTTVYVARTVQYFAEKAQKESEKKNTPPETK